jgi:hypothetical protein
MKRIKVNLDDILMVLDAMKENGTQEVVFFESEGMPAIADADEPENIIRFQPFDSEVENIDGDAVH